MPFWEARKKGKKYIINLIPPWWGFKNNIIISGGIVKTRIIYLVDSMLGILLMMKPQCPYGPKDQKWQALALVPIPSCIIQEFKDLIPLFQSLYPFLFDSSNKIHDSLLNCPWDVFDRDASQNGFDLFHFIWSIKN